jgi:arginine deiminase
MAVPLLLLRTNEEHKSVVHILWAEGVEVMYIHTCLCVQCGDSVLSWRSVHEWTEMFKKGWTSVMNAECLRCPSTSTSNDKLPRSQSHGS